MTILKSYPWTMLKKGQGFFVPALDLDATIEAGLLAAVRAKITDGKAQPCIKAGRLGVLFYRAPLGQRQRG